MLSVSRYKSLHNEGGTRGQRVAFTALFVCILFTGTADAQVQAAMFGGAGAEQLQDVFVRPDESTTLYIGIYNSSEPIPNLTFRIVTYGVSPQEGGHNHFGGAWGWGGFTTQEGRTGPSGEPAQFTYQAGPAAGLLWPQLEFTYGGEDYYLTTVNGLVMGISADDLPDLGTGDFIRIGATSTHPDNHYGLSSFISNLHQLASDYHARWPDLAVLAYNDMSLRRGGIFDLNSNYAPPHNQHREGFNVDVRANNQPNAIPHDTEVRAWFEERVRQIFGRVPLLEEAGTSQEHYHIFGQ